MHADHETQAMSFETRTGSAAQCAMLWLRLGEQDTACLGQEGVNAGQLPPMVVPTTKTAESPACCFCRSQVHAFIYPEQAGCMQLGVYESQVQTLSYLAAAGRAV